MHDECRGRKSELRDDVPESGVGVICGEQSAQATDERNNESCWKREHRLRCGFEEPPYTKVLGTVKAKCDLT